MSFYRSLAILCAASLIAGAGLCFLQAALSPVTGRAAYAALITGAEVPDTQIRASLSDGSYGPRDLSASVISESTQWVLLDDFSGLKQIPLDEYYRRVLPLDPRNDGYASRLHSFFVRDDQRVLFIPLHSVAAGDLEKRLAKLLEPIPFSLEFIGVSKSVGFFFILFGCAAVALFFFRLRRIRIELSEVFFCLPIVAAFAFNGAAGFVLSALLVGIASLLREPLAELRALPRRAGIPLSADTEFRNRFRRDVYGPFKYYWLAAVCFTALYFLLSFFAKISLLFSAGLFALCAAVFWFSVKIWARRGEPHNHSRFVPVMMTKPALNPLRIGAALPFALAAAVAALAVSALPAAADSADLFSLRGELISEDEYLAHAAFQASFSQRPLGGDTLPDELYPSYTLAADSLIDPLDGESVKSRYPDAPPFPLKNLMEFLANRGGDKTGKK